MMSSLAENDIISRTCRHTIREIYSFLFCSGFFLMWFWLARSISGSSQVVRIISGVDKGSAENKMEELRLFSLFWYRRLIEIRLIRRLWAVTLTHALSLFESQVSGKSISVGKTIFSIVVGLGFVQSQIHMCLRFWLIGLTLQPLRRQRTLG